MQDIVKDHFKLRDKHKKLLADHKQQKKDYEKKIGTLQMQYHEALDKINE